MWKFILLVLSYSVSAEKNVDRDYLMHRGLVPGLMPYSLGGVPSIGLGGLGMSPLLGANSLYGPNIIGKRLAEIRGARDFSSNNGLFGQNSLLYSPQNSINDIYLKQLMNGGQSLSSPFINGQRRSSNPYFSSGLNSMLGYAGLGQRRTSGFNQHGIQGLGLNGLPGFNQIQLTGLGLNDVTGLNRHRTSGLGQLGLTGLGLNQVKGLNGYRTSGLGQLGLTGLGLNQVKGLNGYRTSGLGQLGLTGLGLNSLSGLKPNSGFSSALSPFNRMSIYTQPNRIGSQQNDFRSMLDPFSQRPSPRSNYLSNIISEQNSLHSSSKKKPETSFYKFLSLNNKIKN